MKILDNKLKLVLTRVINSLKQNSRLFDIVTILTDTISYTLKKNQDIKKKCFELLLEV